MQLASTLIAVTEYGGYISLIKLIPLILLFLGWARLLAWVDKDAEVAHLPRELVNTTLFLIGLTSFAIFFFLPHFWLGLGVVVLVLLACAGTYLGIRQKQVGLADLRKDLSNWKGAGGKKKGKARLGEVQLLNKGGTIQSMPDEEDPERAGYDAAQEMLTLPLRKGAERIEVRPSEGASAVQYIVDGVAYTATSLDRATAGAAITLLKGVAGLDIDDRRKPQTGKLFAVLDAKRHELEVLTAGSTAGESLRISIDAKKRSEQKLDTLGFQSEQLAAVQAMIAEQRGIVLVTAPRQQGLTTMLYAIMRVHDAFLNHIQTVEHGPREDLEGITQNKLPSSATASEELKSVEWVASQEPDVVMMDEVTNPASARALIKFAGTGKRVYIGMRQGNTFDALTAWRKLVGDDALAMSQLKMIIAGRVLRRLCMACKIGYAPDPETLRKLNMDPARVSKLFQARTTPLRDPKGNPIPCDFCHDLHYKGRFGVYETFAIDKEVRSAASEGGSINQLKTLFRKQRSRYLQEMALAQVEAGETSVQEVLRVLKNSEPKAPVAQA